MKTLTEYGKEIGIQNITCLNVDDVIRSIPMGMDVLLTDDQMRSVALLFLSFGFRTPEAQEALEKGVVKEFLGVKLHLLS